MIEALTAAALVLVVILLVLVVIGMVMILVSTVMDWVRARRHSRPREEDRREDDGR